MISKTQKPKLHHYIVNAVGHKPDGTRFTIDTLIRASSPTRVRAGILARHPGAKFRYINVNRTRVLTGGSPSPYRDIAGVAAKAKRKVKRIARKIKK